MVLDLTDGKWRSWLFVFFVLYLIIKHTSPSQPDYKIHINEGSEQYSNQINDAFKILAKECPAVTSSRVKKISASYFNEVYEYMTRDYGFNHDVEFEVIDKESGHHQWFDIGDGKTPGILIHKQPTSDFCNWNVNVDWIYFHPI